jgi:AcrR family transcriptional regulator
MLVPPTRRRFDEDQLLDAALEVFYRDGFSDAQTSDIAQQAGTTRPTLHSRLGSKEDVYVKVIQREALTFQWWITEAYQRGRDASLDDLADIGMEPIFRFARERPFGFALLFRGDRTGERPATLRREVIAEVTRQLTALIESRQKAFPATFADQAAALASACVGVALQVCEHALDQGSDLNDAHRFAASFVASAIRNLPAAAPPRPGPPSRVT